jgi:hypothetical protein
MKFTRTITITKVERRVCLIGALFIGIVQSGMAAGQPTQYYRDSCPELVGDWDWTWEGSHAVVSFRNGREAISGGQQGKCITAGHTFEITWSAMNTIDRVSMEPDGRSLNGERSVDTKMSATKRATGAAQAPAGKPGDRCLVGAWDWRGNSGQSTVPVYVDEKAINGPNEGTWAVIDRPTRTFRIRWPGLNTVDTVTLTPDCRKLSGSSVVTMKVTATAR